MSKSSGSRKRDLPIVCGYCGSERVRQIRSAERVLIRCEACRRRLFSYYIDPDRRGKDALPPEESDRFLVRQVERELLEQVSEPAQVLYEFLCRYIDRHGYAPTLREMQMGIGWESINSVSYRLTQLEEAGLIEREYRTARGIRLVYVA